MNLYAWAIKWGIPAAAMAEYDMLTGVSQPAVTVPTDHMGKSEAWARSHVRLQAAKIGVHLWRNNVGVLQDKRGVPVRYGLANDSAAVNERLKSADLIGIRPKTITPADVGTIVGQFCSREIKEPGWQYSGTEREVAQLAWMHLVLKLGGDAAFSTGQL